MPRLDDQPSAISSQDRLRPFVSSCVLLTVSLVLLVFLALPVLRARTDLCRRECFCPLQVLHAFTTGNLFHVFNSSLVTASSPRPNLARRRLLATMLRHVVRREDERWLYRNTGSGIRPRVGRIELQPSGEAAGTCRGGVARYRYATQTPLGFDPQPGGNGEGVRHAREGGLRAGDPRPCPGDRCLLPQGAGNCRARAEGSP